MAASGVKHPLFGGAVSLWLPKQFMDASDFRQVPDNQEVLLAGDSDVSVIVEVLQQATEGSSQGALDRAARFHFDSLAHDNSALEAHVEYVEAPAGEKAAAPPATPAPALVCGTQRVRKFGKASEEDSVHIWAAVWRVEAKNVDLVLSVNDPATTGLDQVDAWFRHAAQTLRIEDYGLFA